MHRVIFQKSAIREAVDYRLGSPGRRIVAVAYVGQAAPEFVTNAAGLEVYCSPDPVGTRASALTKLLAAGARVFFIERLHMKVYWAEGRGAVVGSANLSANGLGDGGLHEGVVSIESPAFDLPAVLSALNPVAATPKALSELSRKNNLACSRLEGVGPKWAAAAGAGSPPSFSEWYTAVLKGVAEPSWKLGWWEQTILTPSSISRTAREEHGAKKVIDYITAPRQDFYQPGDWILAFKVGTARDRLRPTGRVYWLPADFTMTIPRKDRSSDPENPYCAVQIVATSAHDAPPFALTPAFKKAFREALKSIGVEREIETPLPSKKLLQLIAKLLGGPAVA